MAALDPLAVAADLSARGIPVTDTAAVAALLASASAAVRDAAGVPISSVASTVSLWTEPSTRLDLPSRPVTAVSAVSLDGVELVEDTDYVVRGNALWRVGQKWQSDGATPSVVEVTFTHGLVEVPADVVDLVCSLVAGGLSKTTEAYDPNRNLAGERIDDYQRNFRQGDNEVVSPMLLPAATRAWLRSRFGGGAAVVGTVR